MCGWFYFLPVFSFQMQSSMICIVALGKIVHIDFFRRSILVMEIFRKGQSGKVGFLDNLIFLLTQGSFICLTVNEHVLHSWSWSESCTGGEMNQAVSPSDPVQPQLHYESFFLKRIYSFSFPNGNSVWNIIYHFINDSEFCFLDIFSVSLQMRQSDINIGLKEVRNPKHTWKMICVWFFFKVFNVSCSFLLCVNQSKLTEDFSSCLFLVIP